MRKGERKGEGTVFTTLHFKPSVATVQIDCETSRFTKRATKCWNVSAGATLWIRGMEPRVVAAGQVVA